MPKLIGLVGRKGAGKDTAAAAFEDLGYRNLKFAGPLKAMLRAFFKEIGWVEPNISRVLEGDWKTLPIEVFGGHDCRHAMKTLGTEWGRHMISPTLWTDALLVKMESESTPAIFTDVRFLNEEDFIRSNGGLIIKIDADERIGPPDDDHPSERELELIQPDYTVYNNGPVEEFLARCQNLAQEIHRGH